MATATGAWKPAKCPATWLNNEADIFSGIIGASGGVDLSRPVTTHIQELGYNTVGFFGKHRSGSLLT
jgi:hypothetical protein